jgi:hypothetical protein
MGPAVKRQENVVCLALSSPAEDEATMLAPLGRWMRFEQRDFYRVRVDNSEIVCFYDTLTAQGVYWEGTGTSAHDFDGRPTSTAPWDEHLDRLFGRDRKKQGDHSAPQSPLASSPSFPRSKIPGPVEIRHRPVPPQDAGRDPCVAQKNRARPRRADHQPRDDYCACSGSAALDVIGRRSIRPLPGTL